MVNRFKFPYRNINAFFSQHIFDLIEA